MHVQFVRERQRKILICLMYFLFIIYVTTDMKYFASVPPCKTCHESRERWTEGCPTTNTDARNVIVTYEESQGGLGSHIWGYLSVWAVAKHYGLWPAMPRATIDVLSQYFYDLSVPALEDVVERCGVSMEEAEGRSVVTLGDMLARIEHDAGGEVTVMRLPFLVAHTEEVLTRWRELSRELRFKPSIIRAAQQVLHDVRQKFTQQVPADQSLDELEFVGVHVRRTDYLEMYTELYPRSSPPETGFYMHAMRWLRAARPQRRLVFVVTSDDLAWCHAHLAELPDVVIAGSGDGDTPGVDLAVLGACNHTVLAHGTFGLSAAMLARGRHTLVYDPGHGHNTKEMEFSPFLPGWRALDNDGNSHYSPGQQVFKMPYRDGNTNNGFSYVY